MELRTVTLNKKLKPFATEKARYKVAYGGRGSAKSWTVARILLLMAMEKKLRILCTREIQNSIKDSVHRLLSDQIKLVGSGNWNITNDSIICVETQSEFNFKGLFRNLSTLKSSEGYDICWIEEAETISDESWEFLDPTIRKKDSEIWITFNPRYEEDTIYSKFVVRTPPDSIVIQLNYNDNYFFPKVLKDQMEYMKKTEPELYRHIWLGECRKIADTRVFSHSELEAAMSNITRDDIGEVVWGLDVARFGDDRSVLAIRHNYFFYPLETWHGLSTTQLADKIHFLYNKTQKKPDAIFVDGGGVGGGVIDQLSTRGLPIIEANSSNKAEDEQYLNKRAEMYFNLKKKVSFLALPNNRDLLRELLYVEYKYNQQNKTQLISKDIIKKNYGKSPDLADAVALTFYTEVYKQTNFSLEEEWGGGY